MHLLITLSINLFILSLSFMKGRKDLGLAPAFCVEGFDLEGSGTFLFEGERRSCSFFRSMRISGPGLDSPQISSSSSGI